MNRPRHGSRPARRTVTLGPDVDFRPDIEGLRAVAIVAVVAFHATFQGGGFVGVDVFYVISGFLITRLLVAELSEAGRIDLPRFYAARVRRLLPASAVVLVVTALAAYWLLPPLRVPSVLADGVASALYVVNYRYAVNGTEYFAHVANSPFQHYWSLSVEEQFYLLWPVLLIVVARRWRRRGTTIVLLGIMMLASFTMSLLWTHSLPVGGFFMMPPWAFYSLPTRLWQLCVGGLLALGASALRELPPNVARAVGFGGLVMIGVALVSFNSRTAYPGVAALLPVLGTAAVIGAGCAIPERGAGRVLSLRPVRAVGRLSYSWYLWHWPLLVFVPVAVNWHGRTVAVVASFLLAMLTLRYVERPFRLSPALRGAPHRSLALGGALTAVAAAVTLLLPMLARAPVSRGPEGAAIDSDSTAAVHVLVASSVGQSAVPINLSPPLAAVPGQAIQARRGACIRTWREIEATPDCLSGDRDAGTTIALIGDSHAAMWQPTIDSVAIQNSWRLLTMTKDACPLPDRPIFNPFMGRTYVECEQWRKNVLDRLATERPGLVVISMTRKYGTRWNFSSSSPQWNQSLATLVREVSHASGGRVLVLGPVPEPGDDVPVCLSAHLENSRACAPQRRTGVKAGVIAAEEKSVRAAGGRYADVSELFCAEDVCPVVIGKYLVFRDDGHLTAAYARALAPVMGVIIGDVVAGTR